MELKDGVKIVENRTKCKIIIIVFGILLLFGLDFLYWRSPLKSSVEAEEIEEKARKIDKEVFIDYEVKKPNKNSKELITVHFNTDSEYNVGFIDEYGNVVKEPFLIDEEYDYYETLRGEIGVSRYIDEYYLHYEKDNQGDWKYKAYDRSFQEVNLSEEEIEKCLESLFCRWKHTWSICGT